MNPDPKESLPREIVEELMSEGNYSMEYMHSLRTTIEHNILLGNVPEIMDRIKQYWIMINVNMGMLRNVPENIKDYGKGLRKFAMPVKIWINDGVRVTFEAAGPDFWTLVTHKIPGSQRDFLTGKPVPVHDGRRHHRDAGAGQVRRLCGARQGFLHHPD